MTGNELAGMLLLLTGAVAPVFSEEEADVFQGGWAGLKSGDQGVAVETAVRSPGIAEEIDLRPALAEQRDSGGLGSGKV